MSAVMVIAMESGLYTIQHNSLPVALVFYRKQNKKYQFGRMENASRPERFVKGRIDEFRWKLKDRAG